MIEELVRQFMTSGEAAQLGSQLQQQGFTPDQAQGAVTATAEGVADAAKRSGVAGLLGGGGGIAGALGGLLGGKGGGAGGLFGGGGGAGGTAGLPAAVVDPIVQAVAARTGISADKARSAVNLVLPKVVAFAKAKLGAPATSG